jgi:hypothetical protein
LSRTFLKPNHVAYTVTWEATQEAWSSQVSNEKDVMDSFAPVA